MEKLNSIQISIRQTRAYWKNVKNLYDLYAFFVRIFVSIINKIHIFDCLNRYDLKLSGKVAEKVLKKYTLENHYDFNGIYLPRLASDDYGGLTVLRCCLNDVFGIYLYNNDNYHWKYVDKFDKKSVEGSYLYEKKEDNIDITIHENDIVFDIGAWIGDFSAYACTKGATVYAFEPLKETRELLQETVKLNKDKSGKIIIVPFGVGSKNEQLAIFSLNNINSSSSFHVNSVSDSTETVDVIKLDDWVIENNLKVDFIKADIEGFEREMLKGATDILKTQEPKLSLCTYHLPDDPEVMSDIILSANPNYKIIQRGMKMFAYVLKA